MTEYHYELFADHHQFSLEDEGAKGDLSTSWTPEAVAKLLALAPGVIGVGTVRAMTVPVTVEVRAAEPAVEGSDWDQVNEASLEVKSGRIVVLGGTDYLPGAARIPVSPGWYRARLYYGGLNTLSADGLKGKDHYKVVLWPAPAAAPRTLKQRRGESG
ncbi:MAG TPA: hypothetical protein VLX28_10675 [Thermoanaerobaculia bacterium]|nr:hypothetical protein [Thermoanaerobaculia bacterium]